ncbi:MAG TPA: HAD family phosphatase [Bryobacteraceae bacterium]|nr:HAD family phosphatase [Bryobacteraceae bacterium]
MSPKGVLFDFGGVLCFHPGDERFAPIAALFRLTPRELIPLFWARRPEYDAGRLDARGYWSGVAQAAGRKFEEGSLAELVRLEIELWKNFDERVLLWAAHLRSRSFQTGILSNLPRALGEELRATPGFLDPFDHVTFSYQVGSVKPEPAIYQDAIAGLSLPPGEILFLDDREENVEGARQAGLLAEVFSTWEEFLGRTLIRYNLPMPAPETAL